MFRHSTDRNLPPEQVNALRSSVGWERYPNASFILRNSYTVHSVWRGDQLVAMARVVPEGNAVGYLTDVIVHPDYRSNHLAKRLVENIIDEIKERDDFVEVHLHPSEHEHARKLYWTCDFERVGEDLMALRLYSPQ